jgi:Putative Flp pilus-assembly TadE/G-like
MSARRGRARHWQDKGSGATLYIIAVAMVGMLGVSALAIDMVSFYLARAEAQRAADAAALAGAKVFVDSTCTSAGGGCVSGGPQETAARQQAKDVAGQNTIAGQTVSLQDSDVTFNYSPPLAGPEEPQITVSVQRTAARSNAMPTFFAKVFGISTVDVTASATAEAYNPSGGGASVGTSCLKPFLVPNCDPVHTSPANPNCSGVAGYFFNADGSIAHPGAYPAGVIGQTWQLHSDAAPSQWYLIGFTGNSAAALRTFISQCAPTVVSCGDTLNTANGKKVGPTTQGTEELIHASGDGLNHGQDIIDTTIGPPFLISGGSNNPNPLLVGKKFYSPSDSIVSVPVYDGHGLSPGGETVTVIGYMQMFIKDADHKGSDDLIDAVILNIGGCGGNQGGGSQTVTSSGGSPIPIRLIRTN